jgi:NADPH-dependent 2,4-dienoyl-CoA reductase/sulfur reductase-like enzyme
VTAVRPVIPINVQLAELAESFFEAAVARHLGIEQEFADPVVATKGDSAEFTLYLARLHPDAAIVAPPSWPTIPQILRGLSGLMRVPYLRAWQILAGGLQLNTKAVDAAEVAKYFKDDLV